VRLTDEALRERAQSFHRDAGLVTRREQGDAVAMMRWNPLIGLVALGASACESKPGDTGDAGETGDGGVEGFQLIEAEFGPASADEFSVLILTFSDPVAPVDGIAPSDFRISAGISTVSSDEGEQSAYYEPATWIGYYERIELSAIANGPGANQLSITLAPALAYGICYAVTSFVDSSTPEFMVEGGLFPHYAPGTTPVTNTEGVPLAAIGPEWVLTGPDEPYYGYELFLEQAGFPNLIPQIPIACSM
jgi:hypothetical protein